MIVLMLFPLCPYWTRFLKQHRSSSSFPSRRLHYTAVHTTLLAAYPQPPSPRNPDLITRYVYCGRNVIPFLHPGIAQ